MTLGRRHWAIAEGYIPATSTGGTDRRFVSHETLCLLNVNDAAAHIVLTLYFSDHGPVGPFQVDVPARRTRHVRLNDFEVPERVPRDTDYACTIESDLPIVVQHTRLDSRQAELALMTTIAYSQD